MISSTLLILKFALLGVMYIFVFLVVLLILADLRRSGRAMPTEANIEPQFYLSVIGGESAALGRRFLLTEDTEIGRDPDCDVQLDDPSVSSRHSRLRLRADGLSIEDLGSTNGTLLNGAQIVGAAAVRPGDKIKLGRIILQLETE